MNRSHKIVIMMIFSLKSKLTIKTISVAFFTMMHAAEDAKHFKYSVALMVQKVLSQSVTLDTLSKHPKVSSSQSPLHESIPYDIRAKIVIFPYEYDIRTMKALQYFYLLLGKSLARNQKKECIDSIIDAVFYNEYILHVYRACSNSLSWQTCHTNKKHAHYNKRRLTLEDAKALARFKKPVCEKLYRLMALSPKDLPDISIKQEEDTIELLYQRIELYRKAKIICADEVLRAKLSEDSLNQLLACISSFHKDDARTALKEIISSLEESAIIKFPHLLTHELQDYTNNTDYDRRLLYYQLLDNRRKTLSFFE